MERCSHHAAALLLLLLVHAWGCDNVKFRYQANNVDRTEPPSGAPVTAAPRQARRDEKAVEAALEEIDESLIPLEEDSGFDFSFSTGGSGAGWTARRQHPGLGESAAAEMLLKLVRESVDYGPTLVVWLIDRSPSVQAVSTELRNLISTPYAAFPGVSDGASRNSATAQLLTAVCAFGEKFEFPLDPPSPDPGKLARSFAAISVDDSGREMAFTALEACLDKYLPFRTQRRREVIFIMITDEAGDDRDLVDKVAPVPRRYGIPLYVIGVPAPFGRSAAGNQTNDTHVEHAREGRAEPICQGPESVYPERIQLGFFGGGSELELIDSGFGPFALEHLCQTSGGRFLALRPGRDNSSLASSADWPSGAAYNFAPQAMRRYAPEYVSHARYRQLLEENAARQALYQAARLTGLEVVEFPRLQFVRRSEAELTRQLTLAQQSAASLEPAVNTLYETLEKGESARDELTRPRWRAGYDLALGRAAAAKARIGGYNAMLAALKRGRNFERPSSTTWVLEPAAEIEASSSLRRLVKKAGTYLQRVVDEHPGTPWAAVAEYELRTPAGWKWAEK